MIYASPASANRDEDRWGATVDTVDITRADAGQHLQFGGGVHACLGSHLARLQAEAMFTALLDRFETIELAGDPSGAPAWSSVASTSSRSGPPFGSRQVARLPVDCYDPGSM